MTTTYRRNPGNYAFTRLVIWISKRISDVSGSPTITAGSAVPTASEPKASIYFRTGGTTAAGTNVYFASDSAGTWISLAALIAALTAVPGAVTTAITAAIVAALAATATYGVANVTIGASTAAAGTTTTDATVLPAGTAPLYPTTAADGTKGVRIHATDEVTGRRIHIGNGVSNQILKVYPPTGGTINGAAADAAASSASGKGITLICLSSAAHTWLAF